MWVPASPAGCGPANSATVAAPLPLGHRRTGCLAQKQLAVSDPGEQVEAAGELLLLAREDYPGVGGQGVGVDGGYEDRTGNRLGRRNAAVGPGAQRRPQTRSEELFDHLLAGGDRRGGAEILGIGEAVPFEVDDDRQQGAFGSPVYGGNGAGSRGGEADARPLLVFEEQLSERHAVPLPDGHGRPQTDEVGTDGRHPGNGTGLFDYLIAVACYWKVEAFPDRK